MNVTAQGAPRVERRGHLTNPGEMQASWGGENREDRNMWEGQEARGYGEVKEAQAVWQSLKECGR